MEQQIFGEKILIGNYAKIIRNQKIKILLGDWGNSIAHFFLAQILNANENHSHLARPDVNENHSHLDLRRRRQSAELKFLMYGAPRQSAKTKCQSDVYTRRRPL